MITPTPEPKSSPVLDALIEKVEQEKLQEEQEPESKNEVDGPTVNRYTEDGLEILEVDGVKYLHIDEVFNKHRYVGLDFDYKNKKVIFMDFSKPGELNLTPELIVQIPEEIPWYDPLEDRKQYIKYEYYTDTLLPLIEQLMK